jgi:hypothetical protein
MEYRYGELRRDEKKLIKSVGECAKTSWKFRDLLQIRVVAELSRRGKVMSTLVKYWQRIFQREKDDLVRVCYNWQINNALCDGWAKELEKEINKIGLGHIWRNPTENQRGTICNDIERQIFVRKFK